jgi:hypothetical protein
MEKTDGEGHGEFKALVQDWQHDVPVARLDPQHDVQSVDKGNHLASGHVPSNVLACLGVKIYQHPHLGRNRRIAQRDRPRWVLEWPMECGFLPCGSRPVPATFVHAPTRE